MPSLVAELGDAIETHMKLIGLIKDDEMDEHQKKLVAEKRAQYETDQKNADCDDATSDSDFPASSQLCNKCSTKAVIKMDGCMTCLNCGDSKCG